MTAPAAPQPRDPWAALARYVTRTDAWRHVPFVQPPPMPVDNQHDETSEVQPA